MLASLPQGEPLASTDPPLVLRPGCQGVMNVLSAGLQGSAATVQAAGIAKHDQNGPAGSHLLGRGGGDQNPVQGVQ